MPQSTDTIKKCRIVILLAFKVNAKDIGTIHKSSFGIKFKRFSKSMFL